MTDYWFSKTIFRPFRPFSLRETILPSPHRDAGVVPTWLPVGWTNASGGPYDGAALIVKEENWVLDPRRKPIVSP